MGAEVAALTARCPALLLTAKHICAAFLSPSVRRQPLFHGLCASPGAAKPLAQRLTLGKQCAEVLAMMSGVLYCARLLNRAPASRW